MPDYFKGQYFEQTERVNYKLPRKDKDDINFWVILEKNALCVSGEYA